MTIDRELQRLGALRDYAIPVARQAAEDGLLQWFAWEGNPRPGRSCSHCLLGWGTTVPELRALGLKLERGFPIFAGVEWSGHTILSAAEWFGISVDAADRLFGTDSIFDSPGEELSRRAALLDAIIRARGDSNLEPGE